MPTSPLIKSTAQKEGRREAAREIKHNSLETNLAVGELGEAATCKDYLQVRQAGKRETARKLRRIPAPKGQHVIAQGKALGMSPTAIPSPERAKGGSDSGGTRCQASHCAPSGLGGIFRIPTQGVALGYRLAPRWGGKSMQILGVAVGRRWGGKHGTPAPKGQHVIAQGEALGTKCGSNSGGTRCQASHCAPSGLGGIFRIPTQGVALGYRLAPRWGGKSMQIVGVAVAHPWDGKSIQLAGKTRMNRPVSRWGGKSHTPAPKGQHVIAQGIALGTKWASDSGGTRYRELGI